MNEQNLVEETIDSTQPITNDNVDTTNIEETNIVENDDTNTNNSDTNTDEEVDVVPTDTKVKTFTQEEVNEIVKKRLAKLKAPFTNYGFDSQQELDDIVGKGQGYDVLYERNEELLAENLALAQEIAFIKNNIDEARYDDIRAYFKGKEIEFSTETLTKELSSHPEWQKKITTIKEMGSNTQTLDDTKDDNYYAKYFGLSKFTK